MQLVYYTGNGGLAGFHALSPELSAALAAGAGYGLLRAFADFLRVLSRANRSAAPPDG